MYRGRFEQVIGNFVHVFDWSHNRRSDGSSVVKALQLAPCSAISAFDEFHLSRVGLFSSVGIDPLLDFYTAGAIVEPVCRVCSLVGYVAYLADKCELAK
jgi:energy-converting hydrogenase Eha subunit C